MTSVPDQLIGPLASGAIGALVGCFGAWVTMTNRITRIETQIDAQARRADNYDAMVKQLTRLETKMDTLSQDVSKHNEVVERTFKLENDVSTAFARIDDLRADVHGKE